MRQGVLIGSTSLAVAIASSVSLAGMFDTIINIGTGQADGTSIGSFESIGSDTQLNVFAGGTVGQSFVAGLTDGTGVNIEVNLDGGSFGEFLRISSGATMNITAGSVGNAARSSDGGVINLYDGQIGDNSNVYAGGTLNVYGGTIGSDLILRNESSTHIMGGLIETRMRSYRGSDLRVTGGEIQSLVTGHDALGTIGKPQATVTIGGDAVIGWIADSGDREPTVFHISGGVLQDDSTLRGESTISGGHFAGHTTLFGTAEISGGSFAGALRIGYESIANIEGGIFEDGVQFWDGVQASVSGGLIGEGFQADPDSNINLIGTEFFIDGVAIDIEIGETLTITRRATFLSGLLADGSEFEIGMRLNPQNGLDYVSRDATLTITRVVPSPGVFAVVGAAGLLSARRRR